MNKIISQNQQQTQNCFGYKWSKRDTYESEAVKKQTQKWLFERYCNNEPCKIDEWLKDGKKKILDAGCGSGFSALLFWGDRLKNHDYIGVDISSSVDVAQERFKEAGIPGYFIQTCLLDIPIDNSSVDIIFSEGVLHHTDSTEKSIQYLATKLKKDGLFLFYVYAKKAVIREFTDDYIRDRLKNMTDDKAWEALKPLTQLGIELGKLDKDITIPEDIPLLGIKKGTCSLQRFFYWNVMKLFFRDEYVFDEMLHINFDWFRPLNCHRHTPEEILNFCQSAGLAVETMNVQQAGITVISRKR